VAVQLTESRALGCTLSSREGQVDVDWSKRDRAIGNMLGGLEIWGAQKSKSTVSRTPGGDVNA